MGTTPQPFHEFDVVIVGGGLAGLTAADKLLCSGKTVLVLEARHEIGGKVQNHGLQNGGIAEVGAEFVGPTQDAALAMIEELGLSTFPVHDHGKYMFWRHNKRIVYSGKRWLDSLPPLGWLATLQLGVAQYRLDSMAAQIDVKAPWNHPKAEQWDSISFEEWCTRWASLADAKLMLEMTARSIWGAEPSEMSLLYVLSYIAGAGNEGVKGTLERLVSVRGGAQEKRVVGGTGLICERLAERIGRKHVSVNTAVTRVASTKHGYRVEWEGGHVTAKEVVVALPPPIMEKIRFEPALPQSRQRLNAGMQMGQMGKVIAVYETPFWRDEGLNGQVFPDEGVIGLTFDNSPEDASFGAILGFFQADEMRNVDKMTIPEIQGLVLAQLAKYFGPRATQVTDFVVQRWGVEKHIWGGPTAVAPRHVLSQYGAALREAVGGIHFAGTETSEHWPGYMDGAIRSGRRAASEILEGSS